MTAITIDEAYQQYADVVYRFFYIKCLDKGTAQDLTSETFMVLVKRMHDGTRDIHDTKKFVYGVMRNVWLMHLRKKYQRNESAIEGMEDFAAYVENEIEDYTERTVKQRAEVFVNRLPNRQKTIITMRLLEEQSIKEIAIGLGKDNNYVKTTYKRGLKRLRVLIAENNGEDVNDNAALGRLEEAL